MQSLGQLRTSIGTIARRIANLHAGRPVLALLGRLAEAGTQGYPTGIKRRLMILNMFAYLVVVTTAIYAVQHTAIDVQKYFPVIAINLALLVMAALVPLAHRFGDIVGGLLVVLSEYAALVAFCVYLGPASGIHLQYFIAAAAPFVVFGLERLRLVVAVIAAGLALHLFVWFYLEGHKPLIDADKQMLDGLYTQAAITTMALIAATVWYAFRLVEAAQAETDALLRNILPDSIVERLKARPGAAVADSFEDASILFADISGFVPLARGLGAERVVELLNRLVSEFDCLAMAHRVEKIKTIGDAYMVASGIPVPSKDHLHRLARMGLDMLETLSRIRQQTGLDLKMRIGIASGPVMAGVIGTRKFSYDVWGDAVNLAARLENQSTPGRILVCPRCRTLLDNDFTFESRGKIEIKGVGPQETWFLTGTKGASPESLARAV